MVREVVDKDKNFLEAFGGKGDEQGKWSNTVIKHRDHRGYTEARGAQGRKFSLLFSVNSR